MGIGELSGYVNATGSGNVFIGRAAGFYETGSNRLYISNNPVRPLLYGVFSQTAASNKLGIGTGTVAAADTIAVWNGAHLTTGGVWTNASSRELKENIRPLSEEDANAALSGLSPVRFVYKNSRDEEYVGFISEDVPDLVATNDRKSLSPMDIVAVLTTVAKEQAAKMAEKDGEIAALRDSLSRQDERMLQMEMALAELQRQQVDEIQVSSSN
ncbi:MAG: tail fiber domain-containing protein [Halioglobus sp.]